jgi:hypothetical protein
MSELALYGRDLLGDVVKPRASGPISERFTLPPFSILDARSGEWQERKRAWTSIGLAGELGRSGNQQGASFSSDRDGEVWSGSGRSSAFRIGLGANDGGATIFDPTLCELAYRWFSPARGQIVDPFAGGSVRGIVAGALGRNYWGCDLRLDQIAANEQQADCIETAVRPVWVCGDSMDMLDDAPDADLIFSCPPYGDLEQYSDDPRDLSAMDWHAFKAAYARIILRAVKRLRPDSFACFVVGDFRDSKGFYRNFVSATIDAFEQCGARLYNEAVLLQATGTAAMRAAKQFEASRKLVKLHQNVLVFCNGDPKLATAKCRKEA